MADVVVTVGGDTVPFEEAINRATSKKRSIGGLDVKGFSQPLGRITGKASEFTKSLEAANARVIAFGASAGAIALLKVGFDKLLSSTIEVEKSLVDINTLLNVSSRDLKKFGAGLFEIANQTSVSFKDAAEAATEFSRQGLGAAETLGRTKAAMILAKLSGTDFAQSVNSLTAAMNSFKKESLEAIDIVNRLAAVDARYAVSADDLAEGIKRVGSSAADSNVTLNQTIALITSAQQTTARGGAVIGNSFKTIFTRLQRPGVLRQLEEIGIRTKESSGEVRPLVSVLSDLAKTYDKLAPSQRAYTAEVVGGVFQINVLKAIMSDLGGGFSVYEGALRAATGATGEAEKRIEQLNQTIAGKLVQTLNSFQEFGAAVGGTGFADVIKQGLDAASSAGSSLTGSLDSEGMGGDLARGVMKGLANVISGPGVQLITFTILKLFQKLASFGADAVKGFLRVGSAAEKLENVQKAAFMFLQKHPELLARVANGTMKVEDVQKLITTEIGQQNILLREQERLSLVIAKKMVASGASTVAAPTMMGRAKGYIPNFNEFSREEQEARSLGASAGVRGKMGRGTIGGQKFVMNNQEIEIPGFGRNGDSAVIPQYSGGHVPNFATKVLDRDHLRQLFGSKRGETDKVFEAIASKAAQANAISNIITGPPGIGKTTLAMQQGGKLISSAGQFNPAKDDLVILRALVTSGLDKPENKEVFGAAKQITGLRGSAGLIEKMRGMRDSEIVAGTSKTGFGRKPGSTKGANSSSLVSEALLNDKFGSKFKLFERGDDFSLKELTERTGIEDFEASVLMGAFSPFTKGHEKLLKSATKKPIAFVAGGVNREDDVGLSVSEKKKMIGKAFGIPTVSGERGVPIAAPGGEYAFESGGKVMRFDTRGSEIVLGADRADDEAFTKKFKSQGLAINTKDKSRISSGTSVRSAIVNGDMSFLKNNLASPIYDMVEGNLSTLQERARLIKGRKVGAADHVADLNAEYDAVGRKKKPKEDPAITAKRDAIRKKLKLFEGKLKGKVKSRVFDRMGLQLNLAGGHVPNFAKKVDNLSQTASVNHRMTGDKEKVSLRQALQMIEKNHLNKAGATAGFGKEVVDKAFDIVARAGRIHKAGIKRKDLESKHGNIKRGSVGELALTNSKVMRVLDGNSRGQENVQSDDMIVQRGGLREIEIPAGPMYGSKYETFVQGIANGGKERNAFLKKNPEYDNRSWLRKIGMLSGLQLAHTGYNEGDESAIDGIVKGGLVEIKGIQSANGRAPGVGNSKVKQKFPRSLVEEWNTLGAGTGIGGVRGKFTSGTDKLSYRGMLVRNAAAAGFIPNFNALGDAVSREQAAGLSASSIRVGSDASLVNAGNPGGLGVYNTTQETSLKDGMSKARAAGINPKTKGKAAGFIPNFAEGDFAISSALGTLQFLIPQLAMLTGGANKFNRELKTSDDAIAKLTGELNKLKKAGQDTASTQKKLNTATAQNKIAKEGVAKNEKRETTKGKIIQGGFIASAALEGLGGMIDSFGPEISKAKDATVGYTNALARSAQVFAAFPNRVGGVLAVFAAVAGIWGQIKKSSIALDDSIRIQAQTILQNTQRAQASLVKYIQSNNAYSETLNNASSSQVDIIRVNKKRQEAEAELARYAPRALAKLKAADSSGSSSQISAARQEAGDTFGKQQRSAEGVDKLNDLVQKNTGVGKTFGVVDVGDSETVESANIKSFTEVIIQGLKDQKGNNGENSLWQGMLDGGIKAPAGLDSLTGPLGDAFKSFEKELNGGVLQSINTLLMAEIRVTNQRAKAAKEIQEQQEKVNRSFEGYVERMEHSVFVTGKTDNLIKFAKSIRGINEVSGKFDLQAKVAALFGDKRQERRAQADSRMSKGMGDLYAGALSKFSSPGAKGQGGHFNKQDATDQKISARFSKLFEDAGAGGARGLSRLPAVLETLSQGGPPKEGEAETRTLEPIRRFFPELLNKLNGLQEDRKMLDNDYFAFESGLSPDELEAKKGSLDKQILDEQKKAVNAMIKVSNTAQKLKEETRAGFESVTNIENKILRDQLKLISIEKDLATAGGIGTSLDREKGDALINRLSLGSLNANLGNTGAARGSGMIAQVGAVAELVGGMEFISPQSREIIAQNNAPNIASANKDLLERALRSTSEPSLRREIKTQLRPENLNRVALRQSRAAVGISEKDGKIQAIKSPFADALENFGTRLGNFSETFGREAAAAIFGALDFGRTSKALEGTAEALKGLADGSLTEKSMLDELRKILEELKKTQTGEEVEIPPNPTVTPPKSPTKIFTDSFSGGEKAALSGAAAATAALVRNKMKKEAAERVAAKAAADAAAKAKAVADAADAAGDVVKKPLPTKAAADAADAVGDVVKKPLTTLPNVLKTVTEGVPTGGPAQLVRLSPTDAMPVNVKPTPSSTVKRAQEMLDSAADKMRKGHSATRQLQAVAEIWSKETASRVAPKVTAPVVQVATKVVEPVIDTAVKTATKTTLKGVVQGTAKNTSKLLGIPLFGDFVDIGSSYLGAFAGGGGTRAESVNAGDGPNESAPSQVVGDEMWDVVTNRALPTMVDHDDDPNTPDREEYGGIMGDWASGIGLKNLVSSLFLGGDVQEQFNNESDVLRMEAKFTRSEKAKERQEQNAQDAINGVLPPKPGQAEGDSTRDNDGMDNFGYYPDVGLMKMEAVTGGKTLSDVVIKVDELRRAITFASENEKKNVEVEGQIEIKLDAEEISEELSDSLMALLSPSISRKVKDILAEAMGNPRPPRTTA